MIVLKQIEIEGFKSIKQTSLTLRSLNILIGGNGAGKSNFLSLFRLLHALRELKFHDFVEAEGGGSTFLYAGPKITPVARIKIAANAGGDPVSLALRLSFSSDDQLHLGSERIDLPPPLRAETKRRASQFMNYPKTRRSEVAAVSVALEHALQGWRTFHFHDTSREAGIKLVQSLEDNLELRSDGANLAPYLYLLRERHLPEYERIRDTVRLAAPFFDDFLLDPLRLSTDKIRLRWRDRSMGMDFGASQISDGTLRFACLVTLLLQPPAMRPSLILIDEPELGLHPYALILLASLLRTASRKSQIIVATQSVALLDQLIQSPKDVADVIVVNRKDGGSEFKRVDTRRLRKWLEEYAPSELWEKGLLGGSPIA